MGYPNFGTMQKWSRLGLIPNKFKSVKPPICLSCQLGKQYKVRRDINNKISISTSVKKPGDLINMDQAETNTPGHPMALSGKNNQEKIIFSHYLLIVYQNGFLLNFKLLLKPVKQLLVNHILKNMPCNTASN
jgi:hypothetical protein